MIRLVRFSVDSEGRALFPDVFTFLETAADNSLSVAGERRFLASVYSMHTDLNLIPEDQRLRAWEWDGWTGETVSFAKWQDAIKNNGHNFKHDVSGEVINAVINASNVFDAILELWTSGDVELKRQLDNGVKWREFEVELIQNP